jgi:DNA-binding transcriptional regulator YdaS (Cro superfamily)
MKANKKIINNPIAAACKIVGGQSALANAIGISQPFMHQIITGVRKVPAEHCPSIERATNRGVMCEELRPDIDWGYLRSANKTSNRKQK